MCARLNNLLTLRGPEVEVMMLRTIIDISCRILVQNFGQKINSDKLDIKKRPGERGCSLTKSYDIAHTIFSLEILLKSLLYFF